MSKEDKKTKKKLAEGKSASKSADNTKLKNKMKKAADSAMVEMAAALPAGGANLLKVAAKKLKDVRARKKVLNAEERAIFASLKEGKINIKDFKTVYRWSEMEPGDVKSEKATCALYAEQMEMELSPAEKASIEEINNRREEARKLTLATGDTGKEVGSAVNTGGAVDDTKGDGKGSITEGGPVPPVKNETVAAGYRAASVAH
jgi:hypothetical protein